MTRARALAVVVVLAGVVGVGVWLARRGGGGGEPAAGSDGRAARSARARLAELRHPEPGSLAGTVTSSAGPVTAATVCARASGAPSCTRATAAGAWQLADLPPGSYAVWASAPGLGGGAWHGPPPDLDPALTLAAGEHRTGVDLAILAGAVEVRGSVRDVRGAPIAAAVVQLGRGSRSPPTYTTLAAADGAFTAWALPGEVRIDASADGFVDADVSAVAPADAVVIVLTPGGTLAGTVVDAASHQPIADADVDGPGGVTARTDAAGHFQIGKLPPGRYKPVATSIGGYGEAAESVLVALGQHVDGVVIEVHAVAVVAGRITIPGGGPCPADHGDVWLSRYGGSASYRANTLDDGVVLLEGVVPGTYAVTARCKHWLSQAPYPDLIVGDSDVEDVTWRVSAGAKISGVVRARTGEAIAGAVVNLRPSDGVSYAGAFTGSDGTFSADGLGAGVVSVDASADGFLPSRGKLTVPIAIGGAATCELVLDRGGTIAGLVVDDHGAPAAGAHVDAYPDTPDDEHEYGADQAGRDGAFRIGPLVPGKYHLEVDDPFHDPYPPERVVHVAVVQNATVDARLVAPAPGGAIDGVVVDGTGAPIADAYVTVGREEDSSWWPRYAGTSDKVLTAADGRFHVGGLPVARFGVRAFRPGAGEATMPHVATGDRVTIAIAPTGVLAGVVVAANGAPVIDVVVSALDRQRDVSRDERAYFTGGRFALRDLPAGTYKVTVDGDPVTELMVPLGEGEQRTDLRVVAKPRYALHGRLVSRAGAPLAGWRVEAPRMDSIDHGSDGRWMETDTTQVSVTAADGTFVIHDLPAAKTTISAFDVTAGADPPAAVTRDITPAGAAPVIEVGDLVVP